MSLHRRMLLTITLGALLAPLATATAQSTTGSSELKMWQDGDAGEKLSLRGRVVSTSGQPVPNARIQMRQADGNTQYTPQYSGVVFSDAKGSFKVLTAVPGQYSSAKHIHIYVYAEGHQAVQTDILFKGDPNSDIGGGGGIEVLLEQIHQGEETMNVGGVEIIMEPL